MLALTVVFHETLRVFAGVYGDKMDADERVELQRMQSRVAMAVGDTEAKVGFLAEIVRENPLDGDAPRPLR